MSNIYSVKASEFKEIVNPLDGSMWKCTEITEDEIENAVSQCITENRSWSEVINTLSECEARQFHIDRIATLYKQEFSNEEHPVGVMITFPDPNYPSIEFNVAISDGNHRVAAAFVRGDEYIELVIATNEPTQINSVLSSAKNIA